METQIPAATLKSKYHLSFGEMGGLNFSLLNQDCRLPISGFYLLPHRDISVLIPSRKLACKCTLSLPI